MRGHEVIVWGAALLGSILAFGILLLLAGVAIIERRRRGGR
jgi:hypothetical protein